MDAWSGCREWLVVFYRFYIYYMQCRVSIHRTKTTDTCTVYLGFFCVVFTLIPERILHMERLFVGLVWLFASSAETPRNLIILRAGKSPGEKIKRKRGKNKEKQIEKERYRERWRVREWNKKEEEEKKQQEKKKKCNKRFQYTSGHSNWNVPCGLCSVLTMQWFDSFEVFAIDRRLLSLPSLICYFEGRQSAFDRFFPVFFFFLLSFLFILRRLV